MLLTRRNLSDRVVRLLSRTCRANHIADVEAARLLAEYVDSFARHFTPAQLLGAGEIGQFAYNALFCTLTFANKWLQ